MAHGDLIGNTECQGCGEKARVTETKTGGLTVSCPSCGHQGFFKSPKASGGLRSRLQGTPPAKAAPAPAPTKTKPTAGFLENL